MFNKSLKLKAAVFDMDGLLIDTEPKWQELERSFAAQAGIDVTADMQTLTYGMRTNEMIRFWYDFKPWPDPDFERIENGFNELMIHHYRHEAKLMPGAVEILNLLRSAGIPLALATSSPMVLIDTFLERFGLKDYFIVCHSAEFEEYGKPHPAVYIATADKLDISPFYCLAFEDSFNGLLAAKAAKMHAIVVPVAENYTSEKLSIADARLPGLNAFGDKEMIYFFG